MDPVNVMEIFLLGRRSGQCMHGTSVRLDERCLRDRLKEWRSSKLSESCQSDSALLREFLRRKHFRQMRAP